MNHNFDEQLKQLIPLIVIWYETAELPNKINVNSD